MYSLVLMASMTGAPDLPSLPVGGGCRGAASHQRTTVVTRARTVLHDRPHLFGHGILFGRRGGCSGGAASAGCSGGAAFALPPAPPVVVPVPMPPVRPKK